MRHRPLRLEPLEDRRMLAALTVTSLADNTTADGLITLREAILASNNDAVADAVEGSQAGSGADEIHFDPGLFGAPRTTALVLGMITIGVLLRPQLTQTRASKHF